MTDLVPDRPPFGSWPRTYALVTACAVVVVLLLWWLSAAYAPRGAS